jgi:hypothetical protein
VRYETLKGDRMHSAVLQHIQNIFGNKAFLSPAQIGATWGWAKQTSYGHASAKTFPVRLTPICGKNMVSFVDYIDFILNRNEAFQSQLSLPEPPKKNNRGRPSNKELVARSALKLSKKKGVFND